MKTKMIKGMLGTMFFVLAFIGCQPEALLNPEEITSVGNDPNLFITGYGHGNPNTGPVFVPFKATFFTKRNYSNSGEGYCDQTSGLPAFNYQYATNCGTATMLGQITEAEIQFCGGNFSPLRDGSLGAPFGNGIGYLKAANGDLLYIETHNHGTNGYVVLLPPGSDPKYDAYFEEPFKIVGGTGRFTMATGGGIMHSYVDLFDEAGNLIAEHQTDHTWTGAIKLKI